MRDGVRLAVDIFLPDHAAGEGSSGSWPTILVFTPYYRRFKLTEGSTAEPSPNTARYRDLFVPRGYAVVVVDVRGTGASFGTREGFRAPREHQDFVDIADWAVAEEWSNGSLGVTGISYLGAAADFLASSGHPAVKAIAPLFSVWDTYADNYYPGGVQLTDLIESYDRLMVGLDQCDEDALSVFTAYAHPDFTGPQPVDEDDGTLLRSAIEDHRNNYQHRDMMRQFAFRETGLDYLPDYSSATFSPYAYSSGTRSDVAIYSVSGWMDGAGYMNGAITRYLAQSENPHHLMLGPWDHGARTDVSPWRQAENPDDFWWFEILRFFDHYLLGMPTGLEQESPVHYYALHEERWHSSSSWPVRDSELNLSLTSNGLSTNHDETLDAPRTVQSDYAQGSGKDTRYERIAGQHVEEYYASWHGRTDHHLTFDSEPLAEGVDVVGHAEVSLNIDCSEPDANLFVYLTEIQSDGTERYVTEGLLRLLLRRESERPPEFPTTWTYRSFTKKESVAFTPGHPERITVPFLPTAWQFASGSRIRLSIAGADADHAVRTPHGRPPVITVTDSATSTLTLPIRRLGA